MNDLTPAGRATLLSFRDGPGNVHELAERTGRSRSGTDKALRELARAELIVKVEGGDPADGAPARWEPTETATGMLDAATPTPDPADDDPAASPDKAAEPGPDTATSHRGGHPDDEGKGHTSGETTGAGTTDETAPHDPPPVIGEDDMHTANDPAPDPPQASDGLTPQVDRPTGETPAAGDGGEPDATATGEECQSPGSVEGSSMRSGRFP